MGGYLSTKGFIGIPVDIAEDSSGDFSISDDLDGRIYPLSYRGGWLSRSGKAGKSRLI
jgi:hypothetical protein|tara:strand:+ start:824 stop:997 length:174 start_codon:yes stop_codon:yes gene_type:complete